MPRAHLDNVRAISQATSVVCVFYTMSVCVSLLFILCGSDLYVAFTCCVCVASFVYLLLSLLKTFDVYCENRAAFLIRARTPLSAHNAANKPGNLLRTTHTHTHRHSGTPSPTTKQSQRIASTIYSRQSNAQLRAAPLCTQNVIRARREIGGTRFHPFARDLCGSRRGAQLICRGEFTNQTKKRIRTRGAQVRQTIRHAT